MKQKLTKKQSTSGHLGKLKSFSLVAIACLLTVAAAYAPHARADSISQQIATLQAQNARNRSAVADLLQTATSYQNAIAQLQGQISQLQGQINDNLARQADLQRKIEDEERELAHERQVLGEDIKAMYTEDGISTIEILATSKDLSDFIDKQTYRNAVQNKIKDTLDKITKLQADQKQQKDEISTLIQKQQAQQASLNANRAEQSNMLALNKQQQDDFNRQTSANQAKIDELIAEQRRANEGVRGGYYFIRFPGAIRGHDVTVDDYPYRDAGFSMQLGACSFTDSYPDSPDRWGYCTRQCVSYAAWAVERSGRAAPMYYGSAKNWIYSAPAAWIHSDPEPGDVAISTAGAWGHAMYVEQVDGNRIYVSQYNQQLDGRYSTQWRTYR